MNVAIAMAYLVLLQLALCLFVVVLVVRLFKKQLNDFIGQTLKKSLSDSGLVLAKDIELKLTLRNNDGHGEAALEWVITGSAIEAEMVAHWLKKRDLVMAPAGQDFKTAEGVEG